MRCLWSSPLEAVFLISCEVQTIWRCNCKVSGYQKLQVFHTRSTGDIDIEALRLRIVAEEVELHSCGTKSVQNERGRTNAREITMLAKSPSYSRKAKRSDQASMSLLPKLLSLARLSTKRLITNGCRHLITIHTEVMAFKSDLHPVGHYYRMCRPAIGSTDAR